MQKRQENAPASALAFCNDCELLIHCCANGQLSNYDGYGRIDRFTCARCNKYVLMFSSRTGGWAEQSIQSLQVDKIPRCLLDKHRVHLDNVTMLLCHACSEKQNADLVIQLTQPLNQIQIKFDLQEGK